jgi:hypothetical protein
MPVHFHPLNAADPALIDVCRRDGIDNRRFVLWKDSVFVSQLLMVGGAGGGNLEHYCF